jgi:hypothetical protein
MPRRPPRTRGRERPIGSLPGCDGRRLHPAVPTLTRGHRHKGTGCIGRPSSGRNTPPDSNESSAGGQIRVGSSRGGKDLRLQGRLLRGQEPVGARLAREGSLRGPFVRIRIPQALEKNGGPLCVRPPENGPWRPASGSWRWGCVPALTMHSRRHSTDSGPGIRSFPHTTVGNDPPCRGGRAGFESKFLIGQRRAVAQDHQIRTAAGGQHGIVRQKQSQEVRRFSGVHVHRPFPGVCAGCPWNVCAGGRPSA